MPPITVQRIVEEHVAEGEKSEHGAEQQQHLEHHEEPVPVVNPIVPMEQEKPQVPENKQPENSLLLELLEPSNNTATQENHLESLLSGDNNLLSLGDSVSLSGVPKSNASVTAYSKNGLLIQLELKRLDIGSDTVEVKALFSNTTAAVFSELKFVAAVPNYLQMEIFKASADSVPANSDGKVTQRLVIKNFSQGELKLKFKIGFKKQDTGDVVSDQGLVQNFPKI